LSYHKPKILDINTTNLKAETKCKEGFTKSWKVVTYNDASEVWLLVNAATVVDLPNWYTKLMSRT